MKENYDRSQIQQAIDLNLIPENQHFYITPTLVARVAELKITDKDTFNSKSLGKRNTLLRLYFKLSALNLLKYRASFSSKGKEGFVYMITDTTRYGYYKIGKSKEPERRLTEANCFSPFKSFKLVRMYFSQDALRLESQLHKYFAEDRVSGEWFHSSIEEFDTFAKNHITDVLADNQEKTCTS